MTDIIPTLLAPRAYAVMAYGLVQKLVVRADVADELLCLWRENNHSAYVVPLYGPEAADEIASLRANITTMEAAARDAIEMVRKEKDAEILRLRVEHHEDTAILHETIVDQRRIIERLMCGMPEDGTTPVIRRIAKLEEDAARLDYIASNARCDPKMNGQHVWWPTSFRHRLFGQTLRAAIDAAMKDKP